MCVASMLVSRVIVVEGLGEQARAWCARVQVCALYFAELIFFQPSMLCYVMHLGIHKAARPRGRPERDRGSPARRGPCPCAQRKRRVTSGGETISATGIVWEGTGCCELQKSITPKDTPPNDVPPDTLPVKNRSLQVPHRSL